MAHSPSALVLLVVISLGLDLSSTVSVEQLNPYRSSIMLMTGFASAGTPSSTCPDATEQASRTRPAPDATTQQKQPAHDAVTLSDVPREFRDKWGKVAGHETFVQLRLCLQTQRSTWAPHPQVAAGTPNILDSSIAGQLNRYQRQRERWIKAVSDKTYIACASSMATICGKRK